VIRENGGRIPSIPPLFKMATITVHTDTFKMDTQVTVNFTVATMAPKMAFHI
jgi:hypothetical protein